MDTMNGTVVLVQPPAWGRQSPPFASALLAAVLRREGFRVRCVDLNNDFYHHVPEQSKLRWKEEHYNFWNTPAFVNQLVEAERAYLESVVRSICAEQPLFIGFSVVNTSRLFTEALSGLFRRAGTTAPLVLGGAMWTREHGPLIETLLRNGTADAIAVGEGEEVVVEIARQCSRGEPIRGIKGVFYREQDRIVDPGERAPIERISDLPYPDYSDFDFSRYTDPHRLEVFATRGCVNRCLFCAERSQWKQFRYYTGQRLFEEVRYQFDRHPQLSKVMFNDSCFNGAIKEIETFCDLVISSGLKFTWGAQGRLHNQMTAERIVKMKRSGCEYLCLGLETASQRILDSMEKYQDVRQCEQIIRTIHNAGIHAYVNFMFGFPGETEEDAAASRDFLRRNAAYIDGVSPSMSFFVMQKEARIYSEVERFHVPPQPHHLYWETDDGNNTYPIRFARYEAFCREALRLGIRGVGVVARRHDKWMMLGDYYMFKKDWPRAILSYQRSLSYEDRIRETVRKIRECYEKNGNDRAARECRVELEAFDQVAAVGDPVRGGLQAFNAGKYQQALSLFQEALRLPEEQLVLATCSLRRYAGICCMHGGDYSRARCYFEDAGDTHPLYCADKCWFDRALACRHCADHEAAIAALRQALVLAPDNYQISIVLGLELLVSGYGDEGMRYYDAGFDQDPSDLEAVRSLLQVGTGRVPVDVLKERIMRHLRSRPDNGAAMMELLKHLQQAEHAGATHESV